MRVFIAGIDGYIGWPLQKALRAAGFVVAGCDNFRRRYIATSLTPLHRDKHYPNYDVRDFQTLHAHLDEFQPSAIVHLAEEPSAPYSMRDTYSLLDTVGNNLNSTMSLLGWLRHNPSTHLVKLGTMGEYCPSSYYHMSKVCDTKMLEWATKVFDLRVTDVMQGPVYGVGGRFDYDECWGTVINRFVVQGVAGGPITVYGNGKQIRSFLPLTDSVECLRIIIQNPPQCGEHRIVNQFADSYQIKALAQRVSDLTDAPIRYVPNPREELSNYEGSPSNEWLIKHGYCPVGCIDDHLQALIESVRPYTKQIDSSRFEPSIVWSRAQNQSIIRTESEA